MYTKYRGEGMESIVLKALAKINLGLDVVRRREDGYHEVRMVMQTIHLYDKLDIKKTTEPGIKITSNLSYVPTNESNLVLKIISFTARQRESKVSSFSFVGSKIFLSVMPS